MNTLNKIKKNWDFSKTTEQNCIHFSNEQEQKRKKIEKRNKWLVPLFCIAVIGISIFTGNPLLALAAIILSISFGSESIFSANNIQHTSVSVIDSTHFVVCYQDRGNLDYGTAIIGTIAGDGSISYGSSYVFSSAQTFEIKVGILDSTHFVVSFKIGAGGKSIIGTISNDDEISFGTSEYFNAPIEFLGMSVIDSTHFVVTYLDDDNNDYGTARIGVISSGNVITFGNEYVFNTGITRYTSVSSLDSTHIIIAYQDDGNSYKGTAIIGTISNGNEIAYGSEYVFAGNNSCRYISTEIIDSTHFIISYARTDSYLGYSVIGTISNGNEISFGTEYQFNNTAINYTSLLLIDSTHFITSYQDNNLYGRTIMGTISNVNEITFDTENTFNAGTTTYISSSLIDSTNFVVTYRDESNSNKGTAIIGTYIPPITFIPKIVWF